MSIDEKLAVEIPPSVDSSLHYLLKTKTAEAKFHFKKIYPNQVHRLFDKVKTGKASKMDLMSNKFLKIAKNIFPGRKSARILSWQDLDKIPAGSYHRIL